MTHEKLTRRGFLKMAALASLGWAAAACTPQAPLTPTSDQSTTVAGQPTDAPPSPVPTHEPVTLVQWDGLVTQSPWVENEIALFREQYPWITIKRVSTTGTESKNTVPLAFKDGTLPDFFAVSDIPLPDAIKAGYYKPLSDFPDFAEFTKTFPQPDIDFVEGTNTIDGKTYTAPFDKRSGWWNQIYVNLDVLKAAGIDQVPETWDAFLEACRTVVKSSNKKVYGYGLAFSTWMTMLWMFGFARSIIVWGQDSRTGQFLYDTEPNYVKMWEALDTLRAEGLVLPEASSIDDEGLRALFAEGKAAFITAGLWAINGWQQTHPDFTNYTVVPPLLLGPKQQYGFYNGPGGGSWHISSTGKHPEEAWLWYKWWHSKPAGERWVKSGNGFSIWPDNNKAEHLDQLVWKDFIKWDNQINFVGPTAAIRNPDCGKVAPQGPKPDESGITSGVFSGQIKRDQIPAVVKKLDEDKEALFQQAIDDAVKAGAKVTLEDFAFPDWDPLKDYVTKPKS